MKFNLTRDKTAMIDFRKWSLFFVCVYGIMIYATYINSLFSITASLCLRAMLGFAVLDIIINRNIKINSYLIWYSLFILLCSASILFVESNISSAISALKTLVVVLGIGVSVTIAVKEKKEIEMVLYCMSIGSVLLMLYLIFSGYVAEYTALNDTTKRFGNELTGNANIFAAIYMIAACTSTYIILTNKKKTVKLAFLLAFALQLYGLVLTGSRKNILIPFIMIYLISIQSKNKNGKYNVIVKTLIAVSAIFAGYWLLMNVPFLYENIGYRFETIVDYGTGDASNVDASSEIRMKMIGKAIELWKQKPILGNGVNAFSTLSGFGTYAHNNFVEILCNQGIVGLSVYYIYYIVNVCKLFNNKMDTSVFKFFGIAFIVSEVLFEFGQITYYMVPSHIMLMLISIYNSKKE